MIVTAECVSVSPDYHQYMGSEAVRDAVFRLPDGSEITLSGPGLAYDFGGRYELDVGEEVAVSSRAPEPEPPALGAGDARERMGRIQNGSGLWRRHFPEDMRGAVAAEEWHRSEFSLGMEYGYLLAMQDVITGFDSTGDEPPEAE